MLFISESNILFKLPALIFLHILALKPRKPHEWLPCYNTPKEIESFKVSLALHIKAFTERDSPDAIWKQKMAQLYPQSHLPTAQPCMKRLLECRDTGPNSCEQHGKQYSYLLNEHCSTHHDTICFHDFWRQQYTQPPFLFSESFTFS